MRRTTKLRLETLEDRRVPTVFNNPWPDARRLTLSFAPDGTDVAGYSQTQLGEIADSTLFAELSSAGAATAWKTEILRAFQVWAAEADINIGIVTDLGRAFGAPRLSASTVESGLLRVGAFAQTSEVIATNSPYNVLAGEWAGDVFLNTTDTFSLAGSSTTRDLFSVMLNEAGNVFGLADSSDPNSALFGSYHGVRAGLSASDITAIRSLYGVRPADAFEGANGNGTLATASSLTASVWSGDPTKYFASASADLTTSSDVDYYSVTLGADTTSAYVYLRTAGLSLLAGKVTLTDASGQQVATATTSGPLDGDLTLFAQNLQPGATYFVRVENGVDAFAVGGYELKVGFGFHPDVTNTTPALTQILGADGSTNETPATATTLTTVPGLAANSYSHAFANASGSADLDYYKVIAPAGSSVLTVIVQPKNVNELFAEVTVYDASNNLLPAKVIVNGDGGRFVVQLSGVMPGADYFLKVSPVGRNGGYLSGDYWLTSSFRDPAVETDELREGTLTEARSAEFVTITVQESQLMQFSLSATTANSSIVSGVRMIVFNSAGEVVFTVTAEPGRDGSGTAVLTAGDYTVRYEAATKYGEALPSLTYKTGYVRVSDPIDPFPADPNQGDEPPPPIVNVFSEGYYASLMLNDPWLNPWEF